MSNNKKLTIKTHGNAAITINRHAVKAEKLVYLAQANKSFTYPHGKSRIVYIGTTKDGASRIASSAAAKAADLLKLHGVTRLDFHVVTCASRQKVKTWRKLESGLILAFKHRYGEVPKCNIQGKNKAWGDELEYFTRDRLEKVLEKYSKLKP
jgi:predicted GIY-YIG superfamily endonuclease